MQRNAWDRYTFWNYYHLGGYSGCPSHFPGGTHGSTCSLTTCRRLTQSLRRPVPPARRDLFSKVFLAQDSQDAAYVAIKQLKQSGVPTR